MIKELAKFVEAVCLELFGEKITVDINRPDEQFGDFATNVALKISGKTGKNPKIVAEKIAKKLQEKHSDTINEAKVAEPGFINIQLTDKAILDSALKSTEAPKSLHNKTVVTEYSDPNPFKILHAGHLYTTLVGDAIANIVENAGAKVHRVNFGGDVGLHVAKTMWAILDELGGVYPDKLADIPGDRKLQWLSEKYVQGSSAYDKDPAAKEEIINLNKQIYQIHADNDKKSDFAKIYWTCRQWSYDGFEILYKKLGVAPFDKYYPESEVMDLGLKTVKEHTPSVYKESRGALVFEGHKHGLHTRVFINSEGLPTYEAKDVGLILQKQADYKPDKSIVITANEQMQYMQVVLKSVEQFEPKLAKATTHLTHGMIRLAGGEKMSSRKGNFLTATNVLDAAKVANKLLNKTTDEDITLGAVKYSLLKNRIGGDIIYDPKESVSLEGNSGPYLQYALVRAKSILKKAGRAAPIKNIESIEPSERSLVSKISEFPEVIQVSLDDLSPHHICSYLYELAQEFNRFYEQNKVIGSNRSDVRLSILKLYISVLQNGLELLGIPRPEKM